MKKIGIHVVGNSYDDKYVRSRGIQCRERN